MLRNYLLIAIRNIMRDKVFSLINLSGLAVGIACFLLLFLFIQDELRYDSVPSKYDTRQVYRVYVHHIINGVESTNSKTAGPLGQTFLERFPEVESYVRIGYNGTHNFVHNETTFRIGNLYAVDSNFFKLFDVEFVHGDARTALKEPQSLVLTQRGAERIFGNENPMGKLLPAANGTTYQVTALIKDFPSHSHFQSDYLESIYSHPIGDHWLDLWYTTYLVLKPGADIKSLESKLDKLVVDKVGPEAEALLGVPMEEFLASGNIYEFAVQPFSSIYLHSVREYGIDPNTEWSNLKISDITYVYMFAAVAAFILLLAVINFMNLATAKSERRAREVGVRKTFGSDSTQLMIQFIGESVLMSSLAMMLAIGLVHLVLPVYNSFLNRELTLVLVNESLTIPLLVVFVVIVGILAGSYPAFYLSTAKASRVLKSREPVAEGRGLLRGSLVVIQFAISIGLLIATMVVHQQLTFIQHKNLGFNKEHLLSISNADALGNHMEAFKEQMLQNPSVLALTNSSRMFQTGIPGTAYLLENREGTNPLPSQFIDVDTDFLKTFQIEMEEGRFFDPKLITDSQSVIINKEAKALFQAREVIGKDLYSLDVREVGRRYTIIGVIKDFNYESLHSGVRPLVLHLRAPRQAANILTIRVAPTGSEETIAWATQLWEEMATEGITMNYNFVDAALENLYQREEKVNQISTVFSGLAIFIACIGLFGLAAFVTEQRTKEIGVRKVLGASSLRVVWLLTREFAMGVLIANLLAWPVAYLIMEQWLSQFAFRISLPIAAFVLSGLITFVIAFLTVSVLAWKAAEVNPVVSLKHE